MRNLMLASALVLSSCLPQIPAIAGQPNVPDSACVVAKDVTDMPLYGHLTEAGVEKIRTMTVIPDERKAAVAAVRLYSEEDGNVTVFLFEDIKGCVLDKDGLRTDQAHKNDLVLGAARPIPDASVANFFTATGLGAAFVTEKDAAKAEPGA